MADVDSMRFPLPPALRRVDREDMSVGGYRLTLPVTLRRVDREDMSVESYVRPTGVALRRVDREDMAVESRRGTPHALRRDRGIWAVGSYVFPKPVQNRPPVLVNYVSVVTNPTANNAALSFEIRGDIEQIDVVSLYVRQMTQRLGENPALGGELVWANFGVFGSEDVAFADRYADDSESEITEYGRSFSLSRKTAWPGAMQFTAQIRLIDGTLKWKVLDVTVVSSPAVGPRISGVTASPVEPGDSLAFTLASSIAEIASLVLTIKRVDGTTEVVYDGTALASGFSTSTVPAGFLGLFTLRKSTPWLLNFTLQGAVVDLDGNKLVIEQAFLVHNGTPDVPEPDGLRIENNLPPPPGPLNADGVSDNQLSFELVCEPDFESVSITELTVDVTYPDDSNETALENGEGGPVAIDPYVMNVAFLDVDRARLTLTRSTPWEQPPRFHVHVTDNTARVAEATWQFELTALPGGFRVLSTTPQSPSTLRVLFSDTPANTPALFDPSNYAISVRSGTAEDVYAREVVYTEGNHYVDLLLDRAMSGGGDYVLRVSGVTDASGTEVAP